MTLPRGTLYSSDRHFGKKFPLEQLKNLCQAPNFDKERHLKQFNDDPSELILTRDAT